MKLFVICIFFSITAYSQQKTLDENLIPVQKDGKWGFTDSNLKFVIEPQYEDASPFAPSKYKNEVIKVAKVKIDDENICIKIDNTAIDCNAVQRIYPFNVETSVQLKSESETIPKIDNEQENFEKKFSKNYDKSELFYKNPLLFLVNKGKASGIVDQNNKIVVPLDYHFIRRTGLKKQLLIQAGKGDKYYFYNTTGKFILETNYGAFSVKENSTLWIVDVGDERQFKVFNFETEKFINDKTYDGIVDSMFRNGFLRIQRGNKEFYIDEMGKEYLK